VGATPVFVDIDETFTMDPVHVEKILKASGQGSKVKIKGIIPVHLYGHPADMDAMLDFGRRYGVFVLEDCCQAHGARYKGKRVGSMGWRDVSLFIPRRI